jgi:hypothetical protein
MTFMRIVLASLLFLAACGGVIVEGDGGPDVKMDVTPMVDASACNCTGSQWCKRDTTCGSNAGTCEPRPSACPDLYAPVCGFDGHVYPNECSAQAAGTDTSPTGGCIPPAGWVSCGANFCDATSTYCEKAGNDAIGPGDPCAYYSCQPLPTSCKGSKDCTCFGTSTPCVQACTFDGNGFQLVCPGG